MKKMEKSTLLRAATVLAGIVVNVLLGFLTYKLNLPLYLDSIGTIAVASIAGVFPGFLVGVLTNVFCGFFNPLSIYYSVLSVLMAGVAATFVNKEYFKSKLKIVGFILLLALISGGLGGLLQLLLIGAPQFESVAVTAETFAGFTGINSKLSFLLINFILNLVDKGITAIVALVIVRLVPKKQREEIWNSGWKQTPIPEQEIKKYSVNGKRGSVLQRRITTILLLITVLMTVIMGFISMRLYYENEKKEYTANAKGAARIAASVVDAKKASDYLHRGIKADGYAETEAALYRIRNNFPGVKYLYVLEIKEDGCYVIFDLDTEDTPASKPGDKIEFEDSFRPYLNDLWAGNEIEPIESNDISGWVMTAYYPVRDEQGNTTCYVGADVSMAYLSDSVRTYLLKAGLIFAGFFLLIFAYGLWTTRFSLVHPIQSMSSCTNSFMYDVNDPKVLKENVKKIKSLNIHTDDELEVLYKSICKMTEYTVDQVNDIQHQAKRINQMQAGLIITMADMVESRDENTGYHIQKTADYVKIILRALKEKGYYADKLTPKYIADVEMSAPLHDIGKINVPDAVLNKPGKLTDEEFEIMKRHTSEGKKLMEKAINTVQGESYLKEARNMAAYHHEKWDGSGYPEGLKGPVIPLSARVMAVADVFDALTARRVYKEPMPFEKAISIIEEGSGTHFDPLCVEAFLDSLDEVKRVLKKYQE